MVGREISLPFLSMSTPALYNIKTVTGLQDCLVLQVIDSLGNVISGDSYVVRGSIALKNETYNLTVTQDAIGDYLLTWENLPAGVWRYDIFVNEEPLLYGNAIVQGRVTPCVTENTQDLGQFLQVQTDQEGVVKITLSDINSAKWYAEVAKGSADEAKNVLQDTENLSLNIERQIEAGKTEISDTTASSISSINTAENRAIANIDTEKENALDDLSQEVVKAQNYATSAQNNATQSATSATNAQESENKAKEAQTETETLADELEEKFERAVFADNSGNVDIAGGLTVAGSANLNGGAVVPEPTTKDNPQTFGLARSHEAVVRPAIQAWFNEQTRLEGLYKENSDIRIFDYDLPKLTHGYQMFYKSSLEVFSGTIPELLHGNSFFASSKVKSVLPIWPKLVNGRSFYTNCLSISGEVVVDAPYVTDMDSCFYGTNIESFEGNLPSVVKLGSCFRFRTTITSVKLTGTSKLTHIGYMCDGCTNLEVFEGDLSAVIYALSAFSNTKLNKSSALCVLNGLREKVDGLATEPNPWTISIGVHIDLQNDEEVLIAADNARTRGWSVTLQWKGTPSA